MLHREKYGYSLSAGLAALAVLGCGSQRPAAPEAAPDESATSQPAVHVPLPSTGDELGTEAPAGPPAALLRPDWSALPSDELVGGLLEGKCDRGMLYETAATNASRAAAVSDLIEQGDVVPGSSATSPLVQRLTATARSLQSNVCPTVGEAEVFAHFIDDLGVPTTPDCAALPFVSTDSVYRDMLADLTASAEQDRPFLRYLSLASAVNARVCGAALATRRDALFIAVNAVSTAPAVARPVAVGNSSALYRIDLRDYGWNRPIDLDGDGISDFDDGWAALMSGTSRYAAERHGPAADQIARWTRTPVALLPANAFIGAALQGDLYYSLTGASASLFDTARDAGIPFTQDRTGAAGWATYGSSSVGGPSRADRYASDAGRALWAMYPDAEGQAIVPSSAPPQFGGGSIIYALPNGLLGFGVAFGTGQRDTQLGSSVFEEAGWRETVGGVVGAGCRDCHSRGLIGLGPELRGTADLQLSVTTDNAAYLRAMSDLGVRPALPDPVTALFSEFEAAPIDARIAAAELGVTIPELFGVLDAVPELAPLAAAQDAFVDRQVFGASFAAAQCLLSSGTENPPAACAPGAP